MIFNLYTLCGVCIMYIYDIPIRRLMFSYINSIVYFTMLNKYRFRLYNFFFLHYFFFNNCVIAQMSLVYIFSNNVMGNFEMFNYGWVEL